MLGKDHELVANSLSKLAQLYWKSGEPGAAGFYFKLAVKTYEKALGRSHPSTVRIRESYASFLDDNGRSDEAEKYRSLTENIRNSNGE